MRRLLIIPALAIASLAVATPGAATTPPTIEEDEDPVEDVGEEIVPAGEDDDDEATTSVCGAWQGCLACWPGRSGSDVSVLTPFAVTPPVGPAAPRTAQGATGTAGYDDR